jgi:Pyridine nucleotide-disulphide oxidoreductase
VKQTFDLVVIGIGAAGSTVATKCCAAAWTVAIIDSRPYGRTCALRGCDPKKVLVGAAEIIDWTHRMESKGIRAERLGIDWQQLMRFKRSFTEPAPKSREEVFSKSGIATFHGRARFVSPTTVQVGDDLLEGRHIFEAHSRKFCASSAGDRRVAFRLMRDYPLVDAALAHSSDGKFVAFGLSLRFRLLALRPLGPSLGKRERCICSGFSLHDAWCCPGALAVD